MARFDFAFTERDSPEIRARIAHDLGTIVDAVRAADPHLVALVLTGGFSRGEGTVRDGAPINDYDLVAVRSRPGGDARMQALGNRLSDEIGLEVDLLPVWRARLPRVGRKLFWLDLRLGGRVLDGDPSVLASLPQLSPGDLDPVEGARLLGNRAAGLILALPAPSELPDARLVAIQSAKAVLAAMDATLLHEGLYAPTLRGRLALSKGHPRRDLFARAVEWKLSGGGAPEVAWTDARDALLDAVEATGAWRARDGWTERCYHLLRAKRVAMHPSTSIRRQAWSLLRETAWPAPPTPDAKPRFFAARALTLQ